MSNQSSELVEISKLNGDFRKNYGKMIGAFLYWRSIAAARARPVSWNGLLLAIAAGVLALMERKILPWHY